MCGVIYLFYLIFFYVCHIYRELKKEKMKEGRNKGNGTMALTLRVREKYLRFMM